MAVRCVFFLNEDSFQESFVQVNPVYRDPQSSSCNPLGEKNDQYLICKVYPDCHVDDPIYIGSGVCDGGDYNTEECGWDGGDCVVPGYPNCHVDDPSYIGDGYCDNYGDFNTAECEWDGGDCPPP